MFWGIIEKSLRDVSKASAVRTGLEPATPGVTGRYSNQLNYRTNCSDFPSDGFLNGDAKIYFFLKIAILFRKKLHYFSASHMVHYSSVSFSSMRSSRSSISS